MQKRYKLILSLLVGLGIASTAYAMLNTTWEIVVKDVKVRFEEVNSGTYGSFSDLQANIQFDPKALSKSKITASIAAKTVKTGEAEQEADIRSGYLNAKKFERINFESSNFKAVNNGFEVAGSLKIKNTTQKVTIPFKFKQNGKKAEFKGKFEINAKQFDLDAGKVVIELVVPVIKK